MSDWIIRPATPADIPDIKRMSAAIQDHEIAVQGYPLLPTESMADAYFHAISRRVADNRGETLVCGRGGRLVAYCMGHVDFDGDLAVDPDFRTHAIIDDMFVLPDHRRIGIGRALVDAFADRMGAKGCNWLRVWAKARNREAISAYISAGFDAYETVFVRKI